MDAVKVARTVLIIDVSQVVVVVIAINEDSKLFQNLIFFNLNEFFKTIHHRFYNLHKDNANDTEDSDVFLVPFSFVP